MTPITIEKLLVKHNKKDVRNQEVNFDELLKTLALKRKTSVLITKLQENVIQSWTKKTPTWQDLDPYSSLEEMSDSDSQARKSSTQNSSVTNSVKKEKVTKLENDSPDLTSKNTDDIGGHRLRKRKRSYSMTRERRSNSETRYYRGMCQSPKDVPKKKLRAGTVAKNLRLPSKDRIKAQNVIRERKQRTKDGQNDANALIRSYPLFQQNKQEKVEPEENTDSDEQTIMMNLKRKNLIMLLSANS